MLRSYDLQYNKRDHKGSPCWLRGLAICVHQSCIASPLSLRCLVTAQILLLVLPPLANPATTCFTPVHHEADRVFQGVKIHNPLKNKYHTSLEALKTRPSS